MTIKEYRTEQSELGQKYIDKSYSTQMSGSVRYGNVHLESDTNLNNPSEICFRGRYFIQMAAYGERLECSYLPIKNRKIVLKHGNFMVQLTDGESTINLSGINQNADPKDLQK